MDICSVSDKRGLQRVYTLLNSIKHTKKKDTIINYHLVIEDVDDKIKKYFSDLQSQDFTIEYIDSEWFRARISPPKRNYFYYIRLLFPTYFDKLDKVLYLDTDLVFIKEGIEQLWNVDMTNHSIAAITDIPVNVASCLASQLRQTGIKDYFNSGVCVFNFKRMRETGKAGQLVNWCKQWDRRKLQPIIMDQTLLNYLFKGDVQYLQYKFNDYSLMLSMGVLSVCKKYLKMVYGYDDPKDSIKDAIVLHFLGELKPWEQNASKESMFPYRAIAKEYWKQINDKLGKIWEI